MKEAITRFLVDKPARDVQTLAAEAAKASVGTPWNDVE